MTLSGVGSDPAPGGALPVVELASATPIGISYTYRHPLQNIRVADADSCSANDRSKGCAITAPYP